MTQADLLVRPEPAFARDPSLKRVGPDLEKAFSEGSRPGAVAHPGGEELLNSKARFGWRPRRIPFWTLALAGGVIAAAAYVYVPDLYVVETDDASIQADTVSVLPKVTAYVTALHVTDNSAFSAGQLLVELDPRDFQAAVAIAEANLQSAQAAETVAEAQLSEQSKVIAGDEANVLGDRGTLTFAVQQLGRFNTLAKTGAGTLESSQQAQSDLTERQAALQRDTATLAAAEGQVDVLRGQRERAKGDVAQARAALRQAELNLSYTKIYASSAGTVANRSVQVGNLVQPGQILFSAVPDETYVIANFKETQLMQMRVGQPVTVAVDAFPNLRLHGHIDSFQRGTGSNFALLPPENATGNFVKIVQRVPVKILLDDADTYPHLLGPGMSVEATVTVHTPPRWLAWFI
jgi:membrane fusion protein, multidrug efflux system